jgi:hypothetical protein
VKNIEPGGKSEIPSETLKAYRSHISVITATDDYPGIRKYLDTWLEHREQPWIELAELCFRIAGGKVRKRLERVFAGWMILFAISGPLDDYVDQDKAPDAWDDLGRDVGTFVAMALIAEALSIVLGPESSLDTSLVLATMVFVKHLKGASLGQALDTTGIRTLEEYEQMLKRKAASLIAALTEAIAVVAEAETGLRQVLRDVGSELGIAVQIINDYLGIWKPDVVFKNGRCDLNLSKLTYPVLYALQVDHPYAVEFQQLLAETPGKRDSTRMLEILNEIGAPEFMLASLEVHRSRAIQHLKDWTTREEIECFEVWYDEHLLGKSRSNVDRL